MGEVKVNIGKMVNKMQLFKPESIKTTTGEDIVDYKPSTVFLAEVTELGGNSERLDDALSGKVYLKFNAIFFDVTTDWRVEFNEKIYDIDRMVLTGRGLYAVYECSKNNLE